MTKNRTLGILYIAIGILALGSGLSGFQDKSAETSYLMGGLIFGAVVGIFCFYRAYKRFTK